MNPIEPGKEERRSTARQDDALNVLMRVFLVSAAAAVLILGLFLMTTIGGGRDHLGRRLIVAAVAVIMLGAIDRQATKVVSRNRPLVAPDSPDFRRFVAMSVVAFFFGAALLLGVAIFLP
jgi:hypothetical protein